MIGAKRLELLQRILEATRLGSLQWRETGVYAYEAELDSHRIRISFLTIPFKQGAAVSLDAARVSAPGVNHMLVFRGTDAMDLVWEILRAGVPKIKTTFDTINDNVDDCIALLDQFIARDREGGQTNPGSDNA